MPSKRRCLTHGGAAFARTPYGGLRPFYPRSPWGRQNHTQWIQPIDRSVGCAKSPQQVIGKLNAHCI